MPTAIGNRMTIALRKYRSDRQKSALPVIDVLPCVYCGYLPSILAVTGGRHSWAHAAILGWPLCSTGRMGLRAGTAPNYRWSCHRPTCQEVPEIFWTGPCMCFTIISSWETQPSPSFGLRVQVIPIELKFICTDSELFLLESSSNTWRLSLGRERQDLSQVFMSGRNRTMISVHEKLWRGWIASLNG